MFFKFFIFYNAGLLKCSPTIMNGLTFLHETKVFEIVCKEDPSHRLHLNMQHTTSCIVYLYILLWIDVQMMTRLLARVKTIVISWPMNTCTWNAVIHHYSCVVSQSLSSEAVAWICQWLHRTVSTADLYPLIMSASQLPCVWSGVKSHRDTDITLEWLHNYARGRFMGTAIYLLPCKPNHAVFCMHIAWCFYAQRQRELYEDVKFSVEYVSYLPHTYSFYNDVHIQCKV